MIKKLKEGAAPPPKACKICSANFQETFNHQACVFHGEGWRLQQSSKTASHSACLDLASAAPAVQKNGCISFAAVSVCLSACMAGLARIFDLTLCGQVHPACCGQWLMPPSAVSAADLVPTKVKAYIFYRMPRKTKLKTIFAPLWGISPEAVMAPAVADEAQLGYAKLYRLLLDHVSTPRLRCEGMH